LTAPIASAQSFESAQPNSAPTNTALLSHAAFARLIQPTPPVVALARVVEDLPRPSLLRQSTALARQAQAAPAKAPPQKSWASRHGAALGWMIIGGVLGSLVLYRLFTCEDC
jgi:hypothetical protein